MGELFFEPVVVLDFVYEVSVPLALDEGRDLTVQPGGFETFTVRQISVFDLFGFVSGDGDARRRSVPVSDFRRKRHMRRLFVSIVIQEIREMESRGTPTDHSSTATPWDLLNWRSRMKSGRQVLPFKKSRVRGGGRDLRGDDKHMVSGDFGRRVLRFFWPFPNSLRERESCAAAAP